MTFSAGSLDYGQLQSDFIAPVFHPSTHFLALIRPVSQGCERGAMCALYFCFIWLGVLQISGLINSMLAKLVYNTYRELACSASIDSHCLQQSLLVEKHLPLQSLQQCLRPSSKAKQKNHTAGETTQKLPCENKFKTRTKNTELERSNNPELRSVHYRSVHFPLQPQSPSTLNLWSPHHSSRLSPSRPAPVPSPSQIM